VNFFNADRLAGKDGAEVNFFAAQTDAAAMGDDNDFVVEGIVDIGQSLVDAGGGLIDLGGALQSSAIGAPQTEAFRPSPNTPSTASLPPLKREKV
jgi:hypothetical protein